MIADSVALIIDAARQPGKFLRLQADQEKCGLRVFLLEDVENFGRVGWVRAVIEGKRDLFLLPAILPDLIGLRQDRHFFRDNKLAFRIEREFAFAGAGLVLDNENLAVTFTVHVFAGRNGFKLGFGTGFRGIVPYLPKRAIFRAQAPERKRPDADVAGRAHLVHRRDRVQIPDLVPYAVVFLISKVRIQGVWIELDFRTGLARMQPCLLDIVGVHVHHAPGLRRNAPIIAIAADGADDLGFGNVLERLLQVGGEPVLRGHRPGRAGGLVLVIVHDDHPVRGSGKAVVVIVPV